MLEICIRTVLEPEEKKGRREEETRRETKRKERER